MGANFCSVLWTASTVVSPGIQSCWTIDDCVMIIGSVQSDCGHIHEEFLCPKLGHGPENVPYWDNFGKTSISTEVRVSADSRGMGRQGSGAGLVVRQP